VAGISENAYGPREVTLFGIVRAVNLVPLKAISPIEVKPLPSVTEVKDLIEKKAPLPIVVTLLGIVIEIMVAP
jgi:hypothetical protein